MRPAAWGYNEVSVTTSDRQSQPLRNTRGLVVDDSALAVRIAGLLQRWGAAVDTAASVAAAKVLLAAHTYDWATLDVDLGEHQESGIDLAHWLRMEHPAIVRIACSAATTRLNVAIAADAATTPAQPLYHGRLDKPFGVNALVQTIVETVRRQ